MLKVLRCGVLIGIAASAACDRVTAPAPAPVVSAPAPASPTPPGIVRHQVSGQVVNADTGHPVADTRVTFGLSENAVSTVSNADGTFALTIDTPGSVNFLRHVVSVPAGYDEPEDNVRYVPTGAAERLTIRVYPALVVRQGDTLESRVNSDVQCYGHDHVVASRRVRIAGAPGESVELEIVSASPAQAVGLSKNCENAVVTGGDPINFPTMRRLVVPTGEEARIIGAGTVTFTARRP